MAKRLKKKLPENFDELIKRGDIEELKEVFQTCELPAYGGYRKNTALAFEGISDDFVRWLVDQGADINATNNFGNSVLHEQARHKNSNIELFIELGADINAQGSLNKTPLFTATDAYNLDATRILIEHGADMYAQEKLSGNTPIEYALQRCNNSGVEQIVKVSELYFEQGIVISDKMKEYVTKIGEQFEFFRDKLTGEFLETLETNVPKLYEMYGVTPVQPRKMHDGVSLIKVKEATWQKRHSELWDLLVPSSGQAKTVQGEVIRITGRVSHEILDNGGCNWDNDFRMMLKALLDYFKHGNSFDEDTMKEVQTLVEILKNGDADPKRLCELAVGWVMLNPKPIPLKEVKYKR